MRAGKEPASQGRGGSGLEGHRPACSTISGPFPKAGLLGPRAHVPLTVCLLGHSAQLAEISLLSMRIWPGSIKTWALCI